MTSAAEIIRRSGIGSSEIAAVCGVSPYASQWDVYARKKGLVEDDGETEAMFWGTTLQEPIARVAAQRMGVEIEWCDRALVSPLRPWQIASPDAFIVAPERSILEIKTAGIWQAGEWDREVRTADGVPEHYLAQVEWQMSVTGLRMAYIAVLIGGNDFRIYEIPHDPELEAILVEEAEPFWRSVLAGVEPPIRDTGKARRYLKDRFPRERERLREATPEEMVRLDEYARARREADAAEAKRDQLEVELKNAIGDAEGLTWPRGRLTWKRTKDRREIDWQALAMDQMRDCPKEEQDALKAAFARTTEGYRRIHFAPAKEAA